LSRSQKSEGRSFPAWLIERRERRGWTQSELARASGADPATISRMEAGRLRPVRVRPATLAAIGDALGVPLRDMALVIAADLAGEPIDPDVWEIARDLQRLPPPLGAAWRAMLRETLRQLGSSGEPPAAPEAATQPSTDGEEEAAKERRRRKA
jgi:transcriptional regulator with XRE-family HTH domain